MRKIKRLITLIAVFVIIGGMLLQSNQVFAADIVQQIARALREKAGFAPVDPAEQPETEFMFEKETPNYTAKVGDKATEGGHRVRLGLDGKYIELRFEGVENNGRERSFEEVKGKKRTVDEEIEENSETKKGEIKESEGSEEAVGGKDVLTEEQRGIVENLKKQLGEIRGEMSRIGEEIGKVEKEVTEIQQQVKETVAKAELVDEGEERVVEYKEIAPGVDMVYRLVPEGIFQEIIIRNKLINADKNKINPVPETLSRYRAGTDGDKINTDRVLVFDVGMGGVKVGEFGGVREFSPAPRGVQGSDMKEFIDPEGSPYFLIGETELVDGGGEVLGNVNTRLVGGEDGGRLGFVLPEELAEKEDLDYPLKLKTLLRVVDERLLLREEGVDLSIFKSRREKMRELFADRQVGGWRSFSAAEMPAFEIESEEAEAELESKAKVLDAEGNLAGMEVEATAEPGDPQRKEIAVIPPPAFKPGKYTLVVENEKGERMIEQDFTWGVLAVNTNKSIYLPNETAKLAFAVLDENGSMVCDADLKLKVQKEKSKTTDQNAKITEDILTTDNGGIRVNEECRKKAVTQRPDYEAEYKVGESGTYQMELTATTDNGEYTIFDYFEVRERVPFDIERETATRIYPVHEYEVKIRVQANLDFEGVVEERVPEGFEVREVRGFWGGRDFGEGDKVVETNHGYKLILWEVDWEEGGEYELSYSYDAPDISPQFYLLGPLELRERTGTASLKPDDLQSKTSGWEAEYLCSSDGAEGGDLCSSVVFAEQRPWQVAVDAIAHEETQTGGSSGSSSVTTDASLTAVNDHLYLAAVSTKSDVDVDSVSGLGLTWTQVASQCAGGGSQSGVDVWKAQGSPTGNGTVTANLASAPTNAVIAVSRYSGVHASSPVGNFASAVNGGDCDSATENNSPTVDLTTTVANAIAYGAFATRNKTFTPGTGYTERAEKAQGSGGDIASVAVEDQTVATAQTLAVDGTMSGDGDWAVIAVEIKPPVSGPTLNQVMRHGMWFNSSGVKQAFTF